MNKKGQQGPVSMIILLIFFVIVWFVFLGQFVAESGHNAVQDNNITGVEAFGFSNLNLFIWIGLIIGTTAFLYLARE